MFTADKLIDLINKIADVIKENKSFLTDLDQAIGDGDHGINLDRGFTAVKEKLSQLDTSDCGAVLLAVAMVLISKVGGASGPLYGTAFMKAGQVVFKKETISLEDSVNMLDAAIQGIIARGKASSGDKTMLDTLIPAFEALKKAVEQGSDKASAIEQVATAAYEGVEFTKTIAARKGRANYLGDRSIGHQDPGATSSYLMLKVILDSLSD